MTIPGNNLPPLDGERDYMLIYDIKKHTQNFTRITQECCMSTHKNMCDPLYRENIMFGRSLSILQHEHDNIAATLRVGSYKINYTCNEYHIDNLKTRDYNFTYSNNDYDVTAFILSTLRYTHHPFTKMGGLGALIELLNPATLFEKVKTDLLERAHAISLLNEKDYYLHVQHTKVILNDTAITHKTNTEKLAQYVNNTYVNIVHDCSKICAHTVLSNKHDFMTTSMAEHYSLLCTHRLLEFSAPQSRALTTTALPRRSYSVSVGLCVLARHIRLNINYML